MGVGGPRLKPQMLKSKLTSKMRKGLILFMSPKKCPLRMAGIPSKPIYPPPCLVSRALSYTLDRLLVRPSAQQYRLPLSPPPPPPLTPSSLMPPTPILPTNNQLINRVHLPVHDLPSIHKIILISPPTGLLLILRNARLHMPSDQPPSRGPKLHIDEPPLVHQRRGAAPRFVVQAHVVALEDDDAVRRQDRDVVRFRVLDCVVEARRVDRAL